MTDLVIVAYRPKPGRGTDLLKLAREHVPLLRRLGLATDRASIMMRSGDGMLVEVFEWKQGAIASAHRNDAVLRLWQRFAAVCDYVPLRELPEAGEMFAQFKPVQG